jgi:hypothetical protein
MNEFDNWFQDFKEDRGDYEWLEAMKPELRSAWNAGVNKVFVEISLKTQVYDSFGPTPDKLDEIEKELTV